MLLRTDRGFNHHISSEITPLSVYAQRREFLQRMAAAGWLAGSGAALAQSPVTRPGKLAPLNASHRHANPLQERQHIQQFL